MRAVVYFLRVLLGACLGIVVGAVLGGLYCEHLHLEDVRAGTQGDEWGLASVAPLILIIGGGLGLMVGFAVSMVCTELRRNASLMREAQGEAEDAGQPGPRA